MLLICPAVAFARAGGSTGGNGGGGGGTSTGGGTTSNTHDNSYYDDYNRHGYYGRHSYSPVGMVIFGGIIVLSFGQGFRRNRKRYRANRTNPDNVMSISSDVQAEFETLFYQVETAWTANDLQTLQSVMAPRYFRKQRRLLNRYVKQHKRDQLEGLVILELGQELTSVPDKLNIVVTAQARDYFQYDNQSVAYNQNVYNNTYIERFTEVWELRRVNQQLIVKNIRQ